MGFSRIILHAEFRGYVVWVPLRVSSVHALCQQPHVQCELLIIFVLKEGLLRPRTLKFNVANFRTKSSFKQIADYLSGEGGLTGTKKKNISR